MTKHRRLRLELTLDRFNRLHRESEQVRSSSTTVRVDKALLQALLRDHSKALAALEGRGISTED